MRKLKITTLTMVLLLVISPMSKAVTYASTCFADNKVHGGANVYVDNCLDKLVTILTSPQNTAVSIFAMQFSQPRLVSAIDQAVSRVPSPIISATLYELSDSSGLRALIENGKPIILTLIGDQDHTQHMKYISVARLNQNTNETKYIVLTGSYNFSRRSHDLNSENLVILHDVPEVDAKKQLKTTCGLLIQEPSDEFYAAVADALERANPPSPGPPAKRAHFMEDVNDATCVNRTAAPSL